MKHLLVLLVLLPLFPSAIGAAGATGAKDNVPSAVVFKAIKEEYKQGEAIILELDMSGVPEGAVVQPGFQFQVTTDAELYEIKEPAPQTYYMWGSGGNYKILAIGMWGVPVAGEPGKWASFGMIFKTVELKILGGTAPPPPPPPPTPGTRWAVIWEETEERTPQQGNLYLELRQKYQDERLMVKDVTTLPPSLRALEQQRPSDLPLPVLMVIARQQDGADKVVRCVPVPSSVADVAKEMER